MMLAVLVVRMAFFFAMSDSSAPTTNVNRHGDVAIAPANDVIGIDGDCNNNANPGELDNGDGNDADGYTDFGTAGNGDNAGTDNNAGEADTTKEHGHADALDMLGMLEGMTTITMIVTTMLQLRMQKLPIMIPRVVVIMLMAIIINDG